MFGGPIQTMLRILLSSIQTHTWDRTENIFHKCIFQMRNKRQEVRQQNNLQHHKLSPTSLLLSSLKGEQKRLWNVFLDSALMRFVSFLIWFVQGKGWEAVYIWSRDLSGGFSQRTPISHNKTHPFQNAKVAQSHFRGDATELYADDSSSASSYRSTSANKRKREGKKAG